MVGCRPNVSRCLRCADCLDRYLRGTVSTVWVVVGLLWVVVAHMNVPMAPPIVGQSVPLVPLLTTSTRGVGRGGRNDSMKYSWLNIIDLT